jgi:hypothetical protein
MQNIIVTTCIDDDEDDDDNYSLVYLNTPSILLLEEACVGPVGA